MGPYAQACGCCLQEHVRSERWNRLQTMARASVGTTVPVVIYLNQRYNPLSRHWSGHHLLPTDRHNFSHEDGTPDPGYEGLNGVPTDEGLQLPIGWQWADDWTKSVGHPDFDEKGWQYAFNWTSSSCESSH